MPTSLQEVWSVDNTPIVCDCPNVLPYERDRIRRVIETLTGVADLAALTAIDQLQDLLDENTMPGGRPDPALIGIAKRMAAEAAIPWSAVVGDRRPKALTRLRAQIAVVLRSHGASLPEIGKVLCKHHTSVLNLLRIADRV